jgi:hypothetical protein
MDYVKHYSNLINRAQHRELNSNCEVHHVIPRCMGGTDDAINLVKLTPEEHFVAHQLLVKIYPDNDKLIYSLSLMSGVGTRFYSRNNKLYGWIKRKLHNTSKTPEHRQKISESLKNKPKTKEHKSKISESLTGRSAGPLSSNHKQKISESLKGITRKPHSEITKQKIGNSNSGKNKVVLVCPVCQKCGIGNVMYRYHFDNCNKLK